MKQLHTKTEKGIRPGRAKLHRYALGMCALLFSSRVLGQMLVAFLDVTWLPPMGQWYSGLLPYPILLPMQIAISVLMFAIVRDFVRGRGYFVTPKSRAMAIFIEWFSYVYFLGMALRYVVTMALYPERRWFSGTIPIWFHMVLAVFLYTYSHYHLHHRIASLKDRHDP